MHNPDPYRRMLQVGHGRFALLNRPPVIPGRTSGMLPWRLEGPLAGPDLRAKEQPINPDQIVQAMGRTTKPVVRQDQVAGAAWFGPEVV